MGHLVIVVQVSTTTIQPARSPQWMSRPSDMGPVMAAASAPTLARPRPSTAFTA